jgi:hypothetical protein
MYAFSILTHEKYLYSIILILTAMSVLLFCFYIWRKWDEVNCKIILQEISQL